MGFLSKITHPKSYYAKYTMTIGDGNFCFIDHEFKYSQTPDREKILYIESAILFLKRYFYIADDRQKQPMKDILNAYLDQPEATFTDLMIWTEKMIFDNLSESERKSLASYVTHHGALPAFLSSEPITNKSGTYTIYIVRNGSYFGIKFYMKLGADKIILSRLPVLFLEYIESNISAKAVELLHTRMSIEVLSE